MKLSEKLAVGATASVILKFLLAGVTLKYGEKSIDFGAIDAMVIAAILTPTLGAIHLETFVGKKKVTPDDAKE